MRTSISVPLKVNLWCNVKCAVHRSYWWKVCWRLNRIKKGSHLFLFMCYLMYHVDHEDHVDPEDLVDFFTEVLEKREQLEAKDQVTWGLEGQDTLVVGTHTTAQFSLPIGFLRGHTTNKYPEYTFLSYLQQCAAVHIMWFHRPSQIMTRTDHTFPVALPELKLIKS